MLRWFKRSSPAATLRTSATELESIRQYRVTRKLGEGGMGVVYEARDERLGRLVAIKRVRGLDADTSLKQRLWREARVAAGISHPNICQVYELAEEGGELFVVMELLTGDTLADRIAQGSLPIGEALQITLGMLVALEAVHARGIIHRDLKPSNVFLTEHGVKLLDFGLARHDNGDPQLNLTRPGTIIGTPRYMAPEVSTSAEAYQLYLRATHICEGSSSPARLTTARDLYLRCVELDPKYAPAWARLGRVHRVLGKYGYGDIDGERRRAAQAFRTALELNPDLALAHNLYTYFEIEEFAAAPRAMLRLLGLIERQPADPDLYAGLVVACRFCGLLQASLAADRRARRIDPAVRTSVHYTHWSLGNYEQTALTDLEEIQALRYAAYWMMGRREEAMAAVRQLESQWPASEQWYLKSLRGAFENDRDECVNATRRLLDSGFRDPEGLVFCARNLARVRAGDFALELLGRIADSGFHCADLLVHDPWFDSIRTEHEFVRVLQRAREGSAEAAAAFAKAGGERLLGLAV